MENNDLPLELQYVLKHTNPCNRELYIACYNLIENKDKLNSLVVKLEGASSNIDSTIIPININTIFKEMFRDMFNKLGVQVTWDSSLESMKSLYEHISEIVNNEHTAEILRDTTEVDCDLLSLARKLDLDILTWIDSLDSYDGFISFLYNLKQPEIMSAVTVTETTNE